MLKQQVETLLSDIAKIIPNDLQQAKSELDSNLRAAITASLAKLDLVTREEFDIQSELLKRSREKVEQLEKQITALEENIKT